MKGKPFRKGVQYVQLNVRAERDQDLRLNDIAWYEGTSKSAIVREAIDDWLRKVGSNGS